MAAQPEKTETVIGITMGDGGISLGFSGGVRTSLRLGQNGCPASMEMTEEARGIRLRWTHPGGSIRFNKLVTWSHLREVDYGQPPPPEVKQGSGATVQK